jgi:hypothetical protein
MHWRCGVKERGQGSLQDVWRMELSITEPATIIGRARYLGRILWSSVLQVLILRGQTDIMLTVGYGA